METPAPDRTEAKPFSLGLIRPKNLVPHNLRDLQTSDAAVQSNYYFFPQISTKYTTSGTISNWIIVQHSITFRNEHEDTTGNIIISG